MFPSLICQDIEQALKEFIITGFETQTPHFKGKFASLVNKDTDGEAFIKGPYVSLGLPFAKSVNASRDFFKDFKTEHSPFVHQETAWTRLSSSIPLPTLVATGTGSGKTECFLYPILNHCLHSNSTGIKAIIIYPMNALATDQAKRFAEVIHSTAELKNKVKVGLFVGGGEASEQKTMGPQQVITCKESLRKNPPDILLTNYKMLDYLLMRPKDQALWRLNQQESLRYLVVDELHTFDGAQGSDLAMLIRRLKAHVNTPANYLVPIGTSATIGSDEEKPKLIEFASKIFDASFNESSIIGETRVSTTEFQRPLEYLSFWYDFDPAWLDPNNFNNEYEYLKHQAWLFFGKAEEGGFDLEADNMHSRQVLGEKLKSHALFIKLLHDAQTLTAFSDLLPESKQLPPNLRAHIKAILASLLALVAHARGKDYEGQSFVSLRFQVWIRELKRIVASVHKNPEDVFLHFSDDLKKQKGKMVLPIVQCSECHATSWLTAARTGANKIETDLRTIYTRFFNKDAQSKVLMPVLDHESTPHGSENLQYLCATCGHLNGKKVDNCSTCGSDEIVMVFEREEIRQVKEKDVNINRKERSCPVCLANNSLILFGSQAASLTSIAVNQIFSNKLNHDKKLIVFSDSVQDAAHRAGFYSARTWDMNVRMAIAQYVAKQVNIPYLTLIDQWFDNYFTEQNWSEEKFISEFIAPSLESEDAYIRMKRGLKPDLAKLLDYVKKRLSWEGVQELGMRSQIGRSLERTGCASISWSPSLIQEAVAELVTQTREQLGQDISEQTAQWLLWGLTLQFKRRGAIFHSELDGFINQGGDYFILTKVPFLPQFGKQSVLPRFPAEQAEKGFEVVQPKQGSSWYLNWLKHIVGSDSLVDQAFYFSLFKLCMDGLIKTGLVATRHTLKGIQVWGLNPERLSVSAKLKTVELNNSDDGDGNQQSFARLFIPEEWTEYLNGLPSIELKNHKKRITEVWRVVDKNKQNFYHDFYQRGEVERVIGHEHTGLLTREVREQVEQRFKAKKNNRRDWYENLLSATPTLEMGIDIGDLSAVILASAPPSQASYLQRIGRAGRSTGNAIALTVANGQPHDLYFYANPMEMMAGVVEPPAIFLEASMVLRRQLLAYCFDDWGRQSQGKQDIPSSMHAVINAVKAAKEKYFPYTLIHYIKTNRDRLWDEFETLLPRTLTDEARQRLRSLLIYPENEEEQVEWVLINRLKELVDEVGILDEHIKSLTAALKKTEKKPDDEATKKEISELNEELIGIRRLKHDILKRDTLNFLTDEGLLPNYTFPEEGATLKSVIFWRSSQSNPSQQYETATYEYTRPAHAAISELAPNSFFYASNLKVSITRVETAKGKAIEWMRICPTCSYSEKLVGGTEHTSCPRCEDIAWGGIQQKVPVIRLTQVYANTSIKEATLGDEKDTREPVFFNKQMLIDIDPQEVEIAYAFENEHKPFGFEFVRKAHFLEVNFGESTGADDNIFNVAGRELERSGFKLCKDCGTVQPKKGKAKHQHYCKYAKSEDNEGIENCLYLYREYTSEAIRILMPSMSIASEEEQINSFVAAMQLGLKKRFGGKVDHLQLTVSDQPIPNSELREKYLLIYDSVPGGTGYLHELLAEPNNLIETFKVAQDMMAHCSCQHIVPEVDGCYRCLYAYRNSYGMENTSRKVALNMLNELLSGDVKLKQIDHLGKVKKSAWEDSLLEQKFPEALKMLNGNKLINGQKLSLKLDLLKGKKAYHLSIGEQSYRMEMHVQLDANDGVAYPCEPDFIIYPVKTTQKLKPIAVFLDGFAYHHNTVHEDLLKRQGLLLSGQYWVWSLSWYDIETLFTKQEINLPSIFQEFKNNRINELLENHDLKLKSLSLADLQLSSFNLLLKLLCTADEEELKNLAALQFLSVLQTSNRTPDAIVKWCSFIENCPESYKEHFESLQLSAVRIVNVENEQNYLNFGVAIGKEFLKKEEDILNINPDAYVLAIQVELDAQKNESKKQVWLQLWQLMNWAQFSQNLFAGEKKETANGAFAKLIWGEQKEIINQDWQFALEEVAEEISSLLIALSELNCKVPKVGYEIIGDKGKVLGEAELVWEEEKIVILLDSQSDDKILFEEKSFTIYMYKDNTEELIEILRNKI